MPDRSIPFNAYYVYALYREDGITPFYIGKGGGDRWLRHEKDAWRNRDHKDRIILKMRRNGIQEVPKRKLAEHLTSDGAASLEVALIAKIGREPNGPLVNKTAGGDGVILDAKYLKKRNKAIKAAYSDPETRKKHREIMMPIWQSKEFRQNASENMKKLIADDPTLLGRRGQKLKVAWARNRKRRLAILTNVLQSPTRRERMRKLMKERWARGDFANLFTPEVIEKRRKRQKATLNQPEYQKILSEAGKKGAKARWG